MDNVSYHGTNGTNARSIVGPPADFKLAGRGELGTGFYSGSSFGMAVHWANKKFRGNGHVVKIEISESEFAKLKSALFTSFEEVAAFWKDVKKDERKALATIGLVDYIMAPFATIREIGIQYKFQTPKAQTALNNANLTLLPCD